MRIKSPEELSYRLAEQLAWRKKELSEVRLQLESPNGGRWQLRAALTLLYAHWEGFIKDASELYLDHIGYREHVVKKLPNNLKAIALRNELDQLRTSKKINVWSQIFEMLLPAAAFQNELRRINFSNAISTRGNLDAEVFKEIIQTLGIDYTHYASKEKAVIDRLVNLRHKIAHGRGVPVDLNSYIFLHENIIDFIDKFRDQIEETADAVEGMKTHLAD